MQKKTFVGLPLIALGALGMGAAIPAMASAASTGSTTYTATLAPVPVNGANGASGTLTLALSGNQATITEHVAGLAATFMNAPFPHVQHIHGGALGVCPTAAADTNHDGVITTTEGQPSYGAIQTTLSTSGDTSPAAGTDMKTAPSGASFDYNRTITLDATTLQSIQTGKAVIVVHGIDPTTAQSPTAAGQPSELVPSLHQAATAPALCGTLTASQMAAVPSGAPSTGGGSTAGTQDIALFALGGFLVLSGTGALVLRKRSAHQS
jgi:hypothetical protein